MKNFSENLPLTEKQVSLETWKVHVYNTVDFRVRSGVDFASLAVEKRVWTEK